jgi:hypothetical protein
MDKAKRTQVCENENANCGKKIRRACAQITLDLRRLWRSYDSSCSNAARRDSQRAKQTWSRIIAIRSEMPTPAKY